VTTNARWAQEDQIDESNSTVGGDMRAVEITKTQFRVTDFISWQREGSLVLSPVFQRRPVWKPGAKSYFIDTVLRALPAPIIYIRERVDLDTQKTYREVVDGQQRLRTVMAYVDESLLKDFNPRRDRFTVEAIHNPEAAGKRFDQLPDELKKQILSYELSTHILPINIEDREVLQMFARLNATGVKLNHQELRNANYFGVFKTAMYELGLEQLDRWRQWKVFTDDQISRMQEVEMTSDLAMNMVDGLTGKSQKRIDNIYKKFDDEFRGVEEVKRRFQHTMEVIEDLVGNRIHDTVYTSKVYFFTLFVFLYDHIYGLGSSLEKKRAKRPSSTLVNCLLKVSNDFQSENVPAAVLDAVQRASADYGRRNTRLKYLKSECNV